MLEYKPVSRLLLRLPTALPKSSWLWPICGGALDFRGYASFLFVVEESLLPTYYNGISALSSTVGVNDRIYEKCCAGWRPAM